MRSTDVQLRPVNSPQRRRADRVAHLAVLAAVGLVGVAALVGWLLRLRDVPVHATAAPLFGWWEPHVGPGTPAAILLAGVVIAAGPFVAARLRWGRLLLLGWAAMATWTASLALAHGWQRGVAGPLAAAPEYLADVPDAPPVGELLRGFSDRIVDGSDDSWTTHVAGHPPGALLAFVGLDRIGLTGSGWAAVVCIVLGSSAVVAVGIAVRACAGEELARRLLPYLVLSPTAIWIGVSADAIFLAVSVWGVSLLALATTVRSGRAARHRDVLAVGAGLLLGVSVYLSYGLVLMLPLAGAVVLLARRPRPLIVATVAAACVALAVTAAGFVWWEGYAAVRVRYEQGFGGERPYAYWVWAGVAAAAVAAGPAVAGGLGRVVVGARTYVGSWWARSPVPQAGVVFLTVGGVVAIVAATLSGLSKGEVERIWLPFIVWVTAATALLPARTARWWLGAQAATALAVEHALRMPW